MTLVTTATSTRPRQSVLGVAQKRTGPALSSLMLLLGALEAPAAASAQEPGLELSLGLCSSIMLGPLSGELGHAVEAVALGPIVPAWFWSAGARLGLDSPDPELFGRTGVSPEVARWRPAVAIELGVTARGNHRSEQALLADLREVSRKQTSPLYLAFQGAPLRFVAFDRFRISLLELQFGTHLSPLGGRLRLQVELVSIGLAL